MKPDVLRGHPLRRLSGPGLDVAMYLGGSAQRGLEEWTSCIYGLTAQAQVNRSGATGLRGTIIRMEPQRAAALVRAQLSELKALSPDTESVEYKTWRQKTRALLGRLYSEDHYQVNNFDNLHWWIAVDHLEREWFERGRNGATAILEAALYDLEVLSQPADVPSSASIDPDLWKRVAQLVQVEDWTSLASSVAIFVEDRIRSWADRPASEVGVALMSAVFSPKGEFPIGQTESEREGWHLLARGFAAALSNVDRHRIQERDDLRRYAIGVLGVGSLLLTQARWEHGNRFRRQP